MAFNRHRGQLFKHEEKLSNKSWELLSHNVPSARFIWSKVFSTIDSEDKEDRSLLEYLEELNFDVANAPKRLK